MQHRLEVVEGADRGLQVAKKPLGIAGQVRQSRDVILGTHLLLAGVEPFAPLAAEIDVPTGSCRRSLHESLKLPFQEVFEGWPHGADVEGLWPVSIGQPHAWLVRNLAVHHVPAGECVFEDQRIKRRLNAVRQFEAWACLYVDNAKKWARLSVLEALDQVRSAIGHQDDRWVDSVLLVEARWCVKRGLVYEVPRSEVCDQIATALGAVDALPNRAPIGGRSHLHASCEMSTDDSLLPDVAALQDCLCHRAGFVRDGWDTFLGPIPHRRCDISQEAFAFVEVVASHGRGADPLG